MPIKLEPGVKQRAVQSLRQYFEEHLEQELGNLDAEFLLDFVVGQVGPPIYNAAVADVQVYLRDRLADLDADLFEPEGGRG